MTITKQLKAVIVFTSLVVLALVLLGDTSFADHTNAHSVTQGAGEVGGGDSGGSITNVIRTLLNVLSWITGVISVIMIIVSGMRISLANGDSSKVGSARNGIIYALVGLVVAILAQVIVQFVLNNAIA